MNKNRALKLALKALEQIAFAEMVPSIEMSDKAIEKWHARKAWKFIEIAKSNLKPIKEALAQPEQEPVAWAVSPRYEDSDGYFDFTDSKDTAEILQKRGWAITPLYTTPPKQEPRNFCPRCGKRTADLTVIHTCTPPRGLEMT